MGLYVIIFIQYASFTWTQSASFIHHKENHLSYPSRYLKEQTSSKFTML